MLLEPLTAIFTTTLVVWLIYFLINHAEMFSKLRAAAIPALPRWISYPLTCALCFAWWILAAFSLFTGWSPLVLWVTPCVLMWDLGFRRLNGNVK